MFYLLSYSVLFTAIFYRSTSTSATMQTKDHLQALLMPCGCIRSHLQSVRVRFHLFAFIWIHSHWFLLVQGLTLTTHACSRWMHLLDDITVRTFEALQLLKSAYRQGHISACTHAEPAVTHSYKCTCMS